MFKFRDSTGMEVFRRSEESMTETNIAHNLSISSDVFKNTNDIFENNEYVNQLYYEYLCI